MATILKVPDPDKFESQNYPKQFYQYLKYFLSSLYVDFTLNQVILIILLHVKRT